MTLQWQLWMHATMGEARLSALACMHIHYDTPVDIDEAMDRFHKMQPRIMALDSVLYDKVNELMGNNLPFIQTGNVIEQ